MKIFIMISLFFLFLAILNLFTGNVLLFGDLLFFSILFRPDLILKIYSNLIYGYISLSIIILSIILFLQGKTIIGFIFLLWGLYYLLLRNDKKTNWHETRSENRLLESQWHLAKQNGTTILSKTKFIENRKKGIINEDGK